MFRSLLLKSTRQLDFSFVSSILFTTILEGDIYVWRTLDSWPYRWISTCGYFINSGYQIDSVANRCFGDFYKILHLRSIHLD